LQITGRQSWIQNGSKFRNKISPVLKLTKFHFKNKCLQHFNKMTVLLLKYAKTNSSFFVFENSGNIFALFKYKVKKQNKSDKQ